MNKDEQIKKLCEAILDLDVVDTGDSGQGGRCPFCYKPCGWNDNITNINHHEDCAVLIAEKLFKERSTEKE